MIGAAITAAASVAYNRCRNCKEAKRRNKRGRTKWELCKMQSVRRVQTMTRHDQWGNVNRDTALHGGDKVERWKGGKEGGKLLLSRHIFFPFQKTSAQVSHTNKKAVLRTWLAARERVLIHTPHNLPTNRPNKVKKCAIPFWSRGLFCKRIYVLA